MRRLRYVFLLLVTLGFAIGIAASLISSQRSAELTSSRIQLSAWSLAQLEHEFLKFHASLRLFQADKLLAEQLQLDYDLLWNRLEVFLNGEENRAIRERFDAAALARSLLNQLKQDEALLFAPQLQPSEQIEQLITAYSQYQQPIRRLIVRNFTGPEAASIVDEAHAQRFLTQGLLLTHPLLDSFTSYGTQLLWPLTPVPTAWSSIFIIDPLYTVPLCIAVALGLLYGLRDTTGQKTATKAPALALLVSSLYLGFTVAGKYMAEQRVEAELARQGIEAQQIFSTTTPFNSLLWRVIVLDGDDYHEALVSWFDDTPPTLERIPRGTHLAAALADSPAHARLAWFTNGVLRYDQLGNHLVVTDIRLGMTGFHPFRFDFATLENGQWRVHDNIQRLPVERGDVSRLQLLWARIWQPEVQVPLLVWADELRKVPLASSDLP
ncbi:metal-dependent hydrolase [Pseudomonas sp. WS 5011]|uniref:metal-dependent hydrolase n=1 Tax=Pseudomonas sp. WS 5011 TaxID=2717477 RepID=UPI001472E531|nr:metal-dependent hydrolase [Pseudomonas sp. WS 5011]NMY50681.1 metal-dependent hydrolase [Pseudomonas sp. WS 5011]